MVRHWLAIFVAVLLSQPLVAQETAQKTRTDEPPKLLPILEDDFAADSLADYQPKGDVTWTKGRLKLRANSSVSRELNAGAWVRLKLNLDGEPLANDGDQAVTLLGFDMEGGQDWLVAWKRTRKDGSTSVRVQILKATTKSGKVTYSLFRDALVDADFANTWTVSCRHGTVRISHGEQPDLQGYVGKQTATVSKIHCIQAFGTAELSRIIATGSLPPTPLTADTRKQLDEAREWKAEAMRVFRQQRWREAAPLLRQAADREMKLAPFRVGTATNIFSLAFLYRGLGEFAKAEPLYLQARDLQARLLGPDHPDYASTLDHLGMLYQAMGRYAAAEPFYLQARDIREKVLGQEHPAYVISLNNLATFYIARGEHAKAEPLAVRSLHVRKKVLGEEHIDYATSLNNLAFLYEEQGLYAKAEPLYIRARDIKRKAVGEEHLSYATAVNNLAILYYGMGDYAKAEPLYLQARDIRKKLLGEGHPMHAHSLSNLAVLYRAMGEHTKAKRMLQQASDLVRESLGEEHPDYATCISNLASLHQALGEPAKAENLLLKSRDIREKALGKEHSDYAISVINLATLYASMGEYKRALPLCVLGRKIQHNVLGERHPYFANTNHILAELYHTLGEHEKSETLFLRSLELTGGFLEATTVVHSQREQLKFAQSQRVRLDSYVSFALEAGLPAAAVLDQVLLWKGATLSRQRAMRRVRDDPAASEAFGKLQDTTRQLVAMLRTAPNGEQRDEWRRRLDELTELKDASEADLVERSPAFRDARRRVRHTDLLQVLPQDAALVDFLEFDYAYHIEDEGKRIRTSKRHFVAFVVRHDHPIEMINLGAADEINRAVDVWLDASIGRSEQRVDSDLSPIQARQFLRKQIWEQVEPKLGDANTIVLSPDMVLAQFPFGMLPGKQAGTYLLEDHRLVTVPVPQLLPTLLSELTTNDQIEGDLLVLGDVDYDADPAGRNTNPFAKRRGDDALFGDLTFKPLSQTAVELKSLDSMHAELRRKEYGRSETLVRGAATEANYRKLAPNYQTIHLATHGFFADPNKKSALASRDSTRGSPKFVQAQSDYMLGFHPGMLSGLAFAGANCQPEPGRDDGILFANEIAFMPLEGVNLVVLSACESGLGPVAGGEGLLGVQRAFQVAGARTTISSLWSVDDLATRRLMERFYRNLWARKMSKLDALREAQLWMLNDPAASKGLQEVRGEIIDRPGARLVPLKDKEGRTSPFLWASFVLSGDWR